MRTKATIGRLPFLVAMTVAATLWFISFPGCAMPRGDSTPAAEISPRQEAYRFALRTLEKKKKSGALAGLEPTADGKFIGTWLWFDETSRAGNQIRFVFKYCDGRPDKQFQMICADGWQLEPVSTR